MAIAVGKILDVTGVVQILNKTTGQVREISSEGEIFHGEVILTAEGGSVSVDMINGTTVTLGGDSVFTIDNDVIPAAAVQDLTADNVVTFESIQQAVLAGNLDSVVNAGQGFSAEQTQVLQARVDALKQSLDQTEELSSSSQEGAQEARDAAEGLVTAGYETAVDNPELNVGDSKVESFTVQSVDGTEQAVTVTITGTNDAAIIGGDISVTAAETDAPLSLSGTLTASDVDNTDNTFQAKTIAGSNGTFTIAENGEWTFEASSAFNELNVGDSKVESFTVQSVDGTEQAVTVTITGTNDAAIIGGDISVTAAETDAPLSLSGTLTASDVDNTDNTFQAKTIAGSNGTFTIAENGEWTFEASSAFNELNVGDSKVESFTVQSVDGTEQAVTVTITGTNDAAIIGGDISVTAAETDAPLSLSGTLTASDVDNTDNTFQAKTIAGSNGTFTIAENGEWTFEASSAFNELNVGDSKVESFTVQSVDGTEQAVTVTITGTNDAAIIGGDISVTAAETDAPLSLSGTLTASDVDNTDNTFQAKTIAGSNGTFTIAENGEWTFEASSAFNELNVGDSKVESFTVQSVDGTEQAVTVTITGTNDAAIIGGDISVTAAETDAPLSLSGTLTASDVDNTDNTFQAKTIAGSNGTFTIAENGEWTFEASSAFNELNVGDSKVESFTVQSVDGTEQAVTVTITGTNDAAIIGGDISVTAAETDAPLSLSGTLTASDVDNTDNTFQAKTIAGSNGTFTIAENGEWTFEASSAFNELNVGDSKVESFTVQSVDGTEQAVTVTITGTNDAAIIGGDISVTAAETDAPLSLSGTLTASDVDNTDNTFQAKTIAGSNGTFTIAENGEWTFEASSAFNELNVGDSKVESFTVQSVDGTEQAVTVTITGTNDAAIIGGDISVTAAETDAPLSLSGTLTASDVDNTDNTFQAKTIAGSNGTFTIAENGEWTFEASSAFNELNVGDSKVESFTVQSVDGTEQAVTVTITGTNDAAIIGGDISVTAAETDAPLSLSGTLTASDVDNTDNTFQAKTIAGSNGTFTIAENGEWTFEASSAFNELNVGDSKVESFTVQSVDGTEQAVTVTITGTNDAAIIGGDISVTAAETDAPLSLSGTLTASDVDNTDNTFQAKTIAGSNGTFTIAENGEWTFEASSAFNELNVGDSKVESFTVQSVDGTEQAVTVTITGTNDAAIIGGDISVTAAETDAPLSLSGTLTASDVDNTDNTFQAKTIAGSNGTFTIAENGEWTFEASSAFNELNVGDSKVESFTVQSVDGTEQAVTVTITGTNDAAIIGGDISVTAAETDAPLSLSGTLTASDVDNTDNTFQAKTIAGSNGTFTIAENGEWTFEASSAFNELNVGDSKVESFTVQSVDGTEQAVTVTITGTNDAAIIGGDISVTAAETDAPLSLSGTLTASDVDNTDNTFQAKTIAGSNGTFTIAENGEWTFEASSAFNELNVGDSKVESFTVQSVDGTEQAVTVTITGTNDAAIIGGDISVTAAETDAPLSLSGTLTASDVDNTDNTFQAKTIAGSNGTFTIAENGEWTFEASSAFNELNVGDSKVESFTVQSVDGTEQAVTVTITGTNDAAIIGGDISVTAAETDAPLSLSGTLTASDVDNTDNTFQAKTIAGSNGTFTIAENGEWTFEASSAFNELNVGDSKVESFTVQSVDGTEQAVTVTITGTNDAAIIGGDISVTAAETDAPLSLSGTLTASDVDNTDNTFQAKTIAGSNGTFTIAENGEWTFEASSAFNELNVGDSKVESFTVQSVDGTEQAVTVTITGTNDAAIIGGDISVTAAETDAPLSLSGTLTASDVDNTDNTFQAKTIAGSNGTFTIAENGEWTFEASSAFNELNVGDSKVESFTVQSVDGTEQAVTVTITGTNDAAIIGGDISVTAAETDAPLSLSGTLTASDVDNTDNTFQAKTIAGSNGTFTIAENGEWTFEASSAFNELNVGDSKVESFTVQSVDGTEQAVTVTITGTNDAAIIGGDISVTAAETDAPLSLSGTLTASDVDNTDNTFQAKTIAGSNGTFTIAENGEWTFEASSAFNELNVGDSKVESFTVQSVDGTEQAVTVTITGTNDAAIIGGDISVTAAETDAPLSLSGTLTASDVDNTDNTFQAKTIAGSNGTFTIAENGEWTFEASSAFNELNVGDSKVESFTVQSVDGTEQAVTVTITGTNDAAIIGGDISVTAAETDAPLSLSGTLTASDVDNTDNTFQAKTIAGSNGTFTIAENGEWTFEASSAFNELNVGDSKVESFTVQSVDGTEQAVTVTITGTNDAAIIGGDISVTAAETDAPLSLSGTLTASDVDNTDNTFQAKTIAGSNGTFTIAENGEWTFEASSAFNELNVGDSKVESFTVQSVDGTEQAVTVTITGTNDAAIIGGDISVTAAETDAPLSLSGTLTASDVDNTDNTFQAKTIAGSNGTFTIAENGEWTFEASSAFNELNVGDSKVESFTVQSVDGTEQAVTVTITGTNDAAIIGGDISVTAAETDAPLSLSGTLTASDVDNTDNTFQAKTIAGSNGTFTIAENGEWTFEASSAFNELNVGDSKVESFTVQSVDGTEQAVTVTITGTNDAPTIENLSSTTTVSEKGLLTGPSVVGSGLTFGFDDVDNDSGDLKVTSVTFNNGNPNLTSGGSSVAWTGVANNDGSYSFKATTVGDNTPVMTVTVDNTGAYSVELHAPIDHPINSVEDILTFDFDVTVSDGLNTSTAKLTVNVEDDMPSTPLVVQQTLDFFISEVSVGGLEAGFKNWVLEKGTDENFKTKNTDKDPQVDKIEWGKPANSRKKSGYEFVDNEALRANADVLDSTFTIGSFTHYNYPTNVNTNGLVTVDLVVKLKVMIDGVEQIVEHTINLIHTETPNSSGSSGWNGSPDDIVEISEQSMVQEIMVGNRKYEFRIDGFKDSAGNLVHKILTKEDKTNTFELFATLKSLDELPAIEGEVTSSIGGGIDALAGADGFKDGIVAVVWDNADLINPDGSYTITNDYGVFTGQPNGEYSFVMSSKARDDFKLSQEGQKFEQSYTITDRDGDSVTSKVVINLNGQLNNATESELLDNVLYGDDNLAEAFIVNPKADLVINKFDLENDVLDLSEVLGGTGTQVTQETLDDYLHFNYAAGEITIDSDGDGNPTTGEQTKVTFTDATNISNNKIVIQIDDEKYDYSGD